jgi:hypothetical protein
MGYADMTAETECGTLVARGRHVKFLPMGRAWDLLMLPPLLPVAAAFHKRDIAKRLQDQERTMVRGTFSEIVLAPTLRSCSIVYVTMSVQMVVSVAAGSFRAQLSERSCYCCVLVQQQYASRACLYQMLAVHEAAYMRSILLALRTQRMVCSNKCFDDVIAVLRPTLL